MAKAVYNKETDSIEIFGNLARTIQLSSAYSDVYEGIDSDYRWEKMRYGDGKSVFKLNIPGDSLTTPPISSGRAYDNALDFKSHLQDADDYIRSTTYAALGFAPGIGTCMSVAAIFAAFQDGAQWSDVVPVFIAAVEAIPGIGTIVNMADFTANGALAFAELYNVRQDFKDVERYM